MFGWLLFVVWFIGVVWLVINHHIPMMRHELKGLGDFTWSIVICLTWPLWGLVMVYFRFKKPPPFKEK